MPAILPDRSREAVSDDNDLQVRRNRGAPAFCMTLLRPYAA